VDLARVVVLGVLLVALGAVAAAAPARCAMSVHYTLALEEDLEAVETMARHFLAETFYGQLLEANDQALRRLVWRVWRSGAIFVAKDDAACVGFIALLVVEHPVSAQLYAEEMAWWVEPAYRKGRIGDSLLACAEGWALQYAGGILKMVAPSGSRVGTYYHHLGYQEVETSYIKRL
jgi:GNAT superfamily N-acetyltransferase